MASTIKIKRSGSSAAPSSGLAAGELAYSWQSNKLYIGTGIEDVNGVAANIDVIGGTFYTDLLSTTPGTTTGGKAIIVNSNKATDELTLGNLKLSGNTLTSLMGDINITPAGSNKTVVTNLYIGSSSLHDYIQNVSGGSLVDSSEIDITFDGVAGTTSLALIDTTVTDGSYGSATEIPTFTVDSKGRLTAASTVSISTAFNLYGDSGVDSIAGGGSYTIAGGEGIDTNVASGTITISAELATDTNAGVATFNTNSFTVTSGDVTIKSGGVSNSQLANDSVTFGSTTVALGATSTQILGVTELEVDNLNINGNEIQSTNANGDIVLNPNGTGDIDVSGAKITNVAEPVNPSDVATKNYVDNAVTGLTWKNAVNLLADSNVALSGNTNTVDIDSYATLTSVHNGFRVLLTSQTVDAENGIYVYSDNGSTYTLTRSTDADAYQELVGSSVFVIDGTVYADTGWTQSNQALSSFTGQSWVQFSGAGAYSAGAGLGQSGTEFFVKVATNGGIEIVSDALQLKSTISGDGLSYSNGVLSIDTNSNSIEINGSNQVTIASLYAGQTSINTLGTITTGTWNADTIATNKGGTGLTSYSTGDLLYGNVSGSLSKLVAGAEGKVLQINSSGLPVWGDIDGGEY